MAGFLTIFGDPVDKIVYGSLMIGLGVYVIFTLSTPRRAKRNSDK